ncbi:hypothetical protein IWQ60_002581 [Tieghemiomyces parasiticus]|uniref:Uncharacterized protein n=1 Tax=Tieghemiomyces parasiticus TaxID=78921 RepID=A0A9W8E0Y4_9FUNG|nr:hypothetical protein IWQ60_002581 [Tieghemiomyces parasiticus]
MPITRGNKVQVEAAASDISQGLFALVRRIRTGNKLADVKSSVEWALKILLGTLASSSEWATPDGLVAMENLINSNVREALRFARDAYGPIESFRYRVALDFVADHYAQVRKLALAIMNNIIRDCLTAPTPPDFNRTLTYLATHLFPGSPLDPLPKYPEGITLRPLVVQYCHEEAVVAVTRFLRNLFIAVTTRWSTPTDGIDSYPLNKANQTLVDERVRIALAYNLREDLALRDRVCHELVSVWSATSDDNGVRSTTPAISSNSVSLFI